MIKNIPVINVDKRYMWISFFYFFLFMQNTELVKTSLPAIHLYNILELQNYTPKKNKHYFWITMQKVKNLGWIPDGNILLSYWFI